MLALSLRPAFRVTTAYTGAEALRLLEFGPRALIADWRLPDIDGTALLEAAHARLPRLPIVVITGDTCFETAQAALPHACALLAKPISAAAITAALRDATGPSAAEVPAVLGALRFDPARATVSTEERAVWLTRAEHRVLSALWARAGGVVSPQELALLATGLVPRTPIEAGNVARRYIHQLRSKLGQWVVETDRSHGYRLCVKSPSPPTSPDKCSEN